MNSLDFSNNYFDKDVRRFKGALQEISEIPISKTLRIAASTTLV